MKGIEVNDGRSIESDNATAGVYGELAVPGLLREWRWWLGPAVLSVALAILFLDPFIGDWDAIDYTILALKGQPSSMALGRSLFIFFNSGLWHVAHLILNLPPEKAYLVFKYAVVVETPITIVACWRLAREVGATPEVSTLAALMIAVSPAFVVYSGQAMTEIPSLLVLATALAVHAKGLRTRRIWLVLAGAAILGAGVNIRETVGFYSPWLLIAPLLYGWRFNRRDVIVTLAACLVFCFFAIGGFAFWFITDIGHYRAAWNGWRASMAMESARHPISLAGISPFLALFLFSSPIVSISLPFAFLWSWRRTGPSRMLVLGCVGMFATLLLLLNYSSSVNWRYFLTGLPAFAPLTAALWMGVFKTKDLDSRRSLKLSAAVILGIALAGGLIVRPIFNRQTEKRQSTQNYSSELLFLPKDSVVMAGAQTVAVTYWNGIGAGQWETIGTGGGWPGNELVSVIERYLSEDKRVFLDTNPQVWPPCGWQQQEVRVLPELAMHFRFRRANGTFYEVRPMSDESAVDVPPFQKLLPENRSEETAKCLRRE
ncbi:MAG: hypothetical protein QOH96_2410 [Blastocatellia bacterium]|nr:hypothetical protein [Blastocatellia bacterium]